MKKTGRPKKFKERTTLSISIDKTMKTRFETIIKKTEKQTTGNVLRNYIVNCIKQKKIIEVKK